MRLGYPGALRRTNAHRPDPREFRGNNVSAAALQQAIADVTAPAVHAIASAGRWGAAVKLRYQVADETGSTRQQIRVYRGTTVLYVIATAIRPTDPNRTYSATWKAPRKAISGALRFCLRGWDTGANVSERSCAPLRVR